MENERQEENPKIQGEYSLTEETQEPIEKMAKILVLVITLLFASSNIMAKNMPSALQQVTIAASQDTVKSKIVQIASLSGLLIEGESEHQVTLSQPMKPGNFWIALRFGAEASAKNIVQFRFTAMEGKTLLSATAQVLIESVRGMTILPDDSKQSRKDIGKILEMIKSSCE